MAKIRASKRRGKRDKLRTCHQIEHNINEILKLNSKNWLEISNTAICAEGRRGLARPIAHCWPQWSRPSSNPPLEYKECLSIVMIV